MKAMLLKAANTPLVAETVPDPVPGPGEAVARVLACGAGLTIHHARAGRLKLDWILVKPYIEDPRDTTQTYRFAPHFARTMEAVNYALEERLSDHNPLSVDLPFEEPGDLRPKKKLKFWPF